MDKSGSYLLTLLAVLMISVPISPVAGLHCDFSNQQVLAHFIASDSKCCGFTSSNVGTQAPDLASSGNLGYILFILINVPAPISLCCTAPGTGKKGKHRNNNKKHSKNADTSTAVTFDLEL